MLYRLLKLIFGTALRIFYRELRSEGEENIPRSGPVLFVANHPNGLIDPMIIGLFAPRTILFLAKSTLFEGATAPLLKGAGAVPVYRKQDVGDTSGNVEMFSACYEALLDDEALLIFPEGVSHSDPYLHDLKTGAARIVLGTRSRDPERRIPILPVGLFFDQKGTFRGTAVVRFGSPFDIGPILDDPEHSEREAVRAATRRIREELAELTFELQTWEEVRLLELLSEIYRAERGLGSDAVGEVRLLQEFCRRYRKLREDDDPHLSELRDRLMAFRDRLDGLGIAPRDLDVVRQPLWLVWGLLWRLPLLVVVFPVALTGRLLNEVPYRVVGRIARGMTDGPESTASIKVYSSVVIFPGWWLLVATGLGIWAGMTLEGSGLAIALSALATLPVLGTLAIWGWERTAQALRRFRLLALRLFAPRAMDQLSEERTAIQKRLLALAEAETERSDSES